ncbi:MAG: S-methyl-5-thioribose-1-phosphate isomerase [Candidatus Aminicenantes bacterium]|nr:MAG: S-methyl-5-thioribose-1-phosphate isomerase [Candidatus Aminicenantes bacterium]
MLPTIKWEKDHIVMIDQRKLPEKEVYVECLDYIQVAEAIEMMIIRGAPAIGVAAAFGVALGVLKMKKGKDVEEEFNQILQRLERTRPTARNLFWALERMKRAFEQNKSLALPQLKQRIVKEAMDIEKEDIGINKQIGFFGKSLLQDSDSILTHCNTGALATAGFGTALGIIKAAFQEGKRIHVYADETRPLLQGARLTCWELDKEKIPVTLITDSMAGHLMQKGVISKAIVGADRIAGNGDTANKIGTYTVAVLAKAHGIPFYIAAPTQTIDLTLGSGDEIPIEERSAREVREFDGHCVTLPLVNVENPAFDVTPAAYISAIITEKGICRSPYKQSLKDLFKKD